MLDPPQNEKNADLDVSEDFKIFIFLDPPQNEINVDLDVSEDFKIFNFWTPKKEKVFWHIRARWETWATPSLMASSIKINET